jgi:oligoribonuclease NrnB/cAMP/cGMP phosphodiesterase (DHH superfamily)
MTNYFVSHTDLDGLSSCALLQFLAHSNQINKSYLVDPDNVDDTVKKILTVAHKDDSLYITDMAPSKDLLPEIDKKFKNWRIYDHHSSRNINSKKYEKYIVSSGDADLSATGLVWKDYNNSTFQNKNSINVNLYNYLRKYVKYVNDYDTWNWQLDKNYSTKDYENVEMLNLMFWFYPPKLRMNFVTKNLIVKNDFFVNRHNHELYVILKQKQNEYLEKKSNLAQIKAMKFNDIIYNVAVVTAEQYISELGNRLINDYNVPISIVISNENVSLRGDSKDDTINVGEIAKKYFNGGGHENAAGGTLRNADNDVKQILLSYFN